MNENKHTYSLILVAVTMIVIAAFSRLLPHPHNFTPIGGMALFAGAVFQRYRWSMLLPFAALWLSDLVLNNTVYSHYYEGFKWFANPGVLVAFAAIFVLGRLAIKYIKPSRLVVLSLTSSILFFLITNFVAWMGPLALYSKDLSGLISCYVAGIPFFGGTVAGDLFYTGVLFGGWYLVNQKQNRLVTV